MTLPGFATNSEARPMRADDIDDRRTPRAFFEKLHRDRKFTVDAAANAENALLPRFWSIADDGLWQSWRDHRVWCNPPYSNIAPWVEKAWHEMHVGGCISIDMLLPANRTEQLWWQHHVEPYRDGLRWPNCGIELTTRFLKGRIGFAGRRGPIKGHTPFGSVLLSWARAIA